jgi:hypothetical protein
MTEQFEPPRRDRVREQEWLTTRRIKVPPLTHEFTSLRSGPCWPGCDSVGVSDSGLLTPRFESMTAS